MGKFDPEEQPAGNIYAQLLGLRYLHCLTRRRNNVRASPNLRLTGNSPNDRGYLFSRRPLMPSGRANDPAEFRFKQAQDILGFLVDRNSCDENPVIGTVKREQTFERS